MSTVHDSYVGFVDETTYGTPVAVTKFFEFISEDINGKYERIDSEALRAGTKVLRSDRFAPVAKGAEGSLKLEVMDRGFAYLLKHMLGGIATVGATAPYTHTATVGAINGKYFTTQVGVVASDGTLHPFTYGGGKVKSWELSNSVDQVLQCSLDLDFQNENAGAGAGALAAQSPTFPSTPTAALLTFAGGSVTIGGTAFAVSDISLKCDNALKTDRWFLGNTKKEPLEEGMRKITLELKGEFNDLTQYNRVKSATAAGAVASVVAAWTSPNAGRSFTVTLSAVRFDEAPVNADGAKVVEQTLTATVLFDGTNSPVSAVYVTDDATP